jgi:hypothetical protein
MRNICSIEDCEYDVKAKGFCRLHYERLKRYGDASHIPRPKRKNGEGHLNVLGYVELYLPSHPNSDKTGTLLQHRFVMAEHLGRPLLESESIHHKNGNRSDNRIENLELWSGSHPKTARVSDLIKWAKEILENYE